MNADAEDVLMIGSAAPTVGATLALFYRADFRLRRAKSFSAALSLAEAEPFALMLVDFPPEQGGVEELVRTVRSEHSMSRHCGLVLVATADTIPEAERWLGRGVNRVVNRKARPEEIVTSLAELLGTPQRVAIRVPVRLDVHLRGRTISAFYQTENISRTGMLIRGGISNPIGIAFDFEFTLPGDSDPIRGTAEIARHTVRWRERMDGFGARFITFEGDCRFRLEAFIARETSLSAAAAGQPE